MHQGGLIKVVRKMKIEFSTNKNTTSTLSRANIRTMAAVCHAWLVVLFATRWSFAKASSKPLTFDIVVYGATPGGVQAAVAAGREGKGVALLEPSLYIGGALTGGLGLADYGQ